MSPASAGRFSTTAPPGKPNVFIFKRCLCGELIRALPPPADLSWGTASHTAEGALVIRKTVGPHVFRIGENSPADQIKEILQLDVTQKLPPCLSYPGKEGLVNLTCGVRNRAMQQNRCWRKCPPHRGQILCIYINNSLSHGLADPGFSVLFPSESNGVCTPELCVAWRKLVEMSAFYFFFQEWLDAWQGSQSYGLQIF